MSDSNFDLLGSLINAQSTKDSLMQSVLMSLSSCDRVVVFEGHTDYQVYDEWLKHDEIYKSSEHICAKGKSQLIELYKHSKDICHSDIINGCKFFVDQDYDLDSYNDNCIATLECYSVENFLVNDFSIESVLKDEFQLDARRLHERKKILNQFREDLSVFNELAKGACLPLFVMHNVDGKALFYKRISDLIIIEYGNVRLSHDALEKIPEIQNTLNANELKEYFSNLPYIRCIRGKYHFEFVKKWLESLRGLINGTGFMNLARVTKDPAQMEMRRFASATPVPAQLVNSALLAEY
ncbi:DUF4435 domain-containing protein [Buttiauxella sp. A111]|uniref:DUF4435 domain-containing protein n=1 Tax=Buttiauxella sp. A111 TaxID=2563088 RepID=UPI0010EDFF57|nr:DUF4435 domain-containing protein [Buttiauxella sp. A111]GDX06668.1 DUF4435 domain-containing protein [Buttiauxella sp. A111]